VGSGEREEGEEGEEGRKIINNQQPTTKDKGQKTKDKGQMTKNKGQKTNDKRLISQLTPVRKN